MAFLSTYKAAIAVAATWVWSRLRTSMPALGTTMFWRTWAYDFVKGNSAAQKIPTA